MASDDKKLIEASHFSPDTLEFIRLLAKHNVRYVIVGGEAVIFHGHARFTGDVDFFYALDNENCDRLYNALREFWDGDVPEIRDATELQRPGYVLQFGRPPYRIDLAKFPTSCTNAPIASPTVSTPSTSSNAPTESSASSKSATPKSPTSSAGPRPLRLNPPGGF